MIGNNSTSTMIAPLSVKMISLCSLEPVKADEDERGEGEVRNASQSHITAEMHRKSQLQISNLCS